MANTPAFWQDTNWRSNLLLPLSYGWRSGAWLRAQRAGAPYRANVPVLCIGNAVAGGAGKTPVALHLAQWLQARHIRVAVISRGYGGSLTRAADSSLQVTSAHTAAEVGDEPLLFASHVPCYVGASREKSIQQAVEEGAQCLILDDGMQNPTIYKDVTLLVADTAYGVGNGRIIPAGPLREPWEQACARADMVVGIGAQPLALPCGDVPYLQAQLVPHGLPDTSQPYVAFAGIGRPEKFFSTLRHYGYTLAATRSFQDHYAYAPHDIEALQALAFAHQARLITTEKDYVRLPQNMRENIHANIHVLLVNLCYDNRVLFDALMYRLLTPYALSLPSASIE